MLGSRIVSARFGLLGRDFRGITTTFFFLWVALKNKQDIMLDTTHLNTNFELMFSGPRGKGQRTSEKNGEVVQWL